MQEDCPSPSSTDNDQTDDNNGSDDDIDRKSDTAVDFSDINELAEDLQFLMQAENPPASTGDDYDDIEDAIPVNKVQAEGVVKSENASDGETKFSDNDKELMPPPSSAPLKSQNSHDSIKSESDSDDKSDKRLETPLAAMLPSKYANVDVRELFPDFRPDKVLRFSRLFGPGKPSSLPQIWRSVRKKRRKRKQSRDGRQRDGSDSTSETDERIERRNRGFQMHYGPEPTKEQTATDDEQLLLQERTDEATEKQPEDNEAGDSKPKVADWRFGPAQVWYDMLEVPDSG